MNVILNAVLEVRVVAIGNLHSKIVVTQHLLCLYNIGCGELFVTDGIWKLEYPICLFKVPMEVKGLEAVSIPDCCPNEPVHGKPFCRQHCGELERAGVPTDFRGFVAYMKIAGNDK